MDKDKYIELLYAEIDRHWRDMAEMSDSFAAEPEVSGEEFKTSRAIVDVLEKSGFDVEYPFMGIPTAFIAKKGKPGSGGKVALLVEYDALPDIGHACGHNLHGSMSVLAGLGLLPLMKDIRGNFLSLGTPRKRPTAQSRNSEECLRRL